MHIDYVQILKIIQNKINIENIGQKLLYGT